VGGLVGVAVAVLVTVAVDVGVMVDVGVPEAVEVGVGLLTEVKKLVMICPRLSTGAGKPSANI